MKRIAKVAAVSAAGLGLIIGATPAQAATVDAGALAFVGSASVTPGLGYPVLGASGVGNSWNFSITTGVGHRLKVSAELSCCPPHVEALGAIGAATGGVSGGTLRSGSIVPGAFCGASGGTGGSGSITIDAAVGTDQTLALNNVGWLQSVGGLILYTNNDGNVAGATVIGLVNAIPPLPVLGTGSCSAGTAQDFTIVGIGVNLEVVAP